MNGLQSVLVSLDGSVLEWLHRHATPTGVAIGIAISRLGSPVAMTFLAFAGALVLVARREWIVLGGWSAAFLGASVLDRWLKDAIQRPRPAYASALMHPTTWSFPSGHAMGALVGYGMLAYVALLLWPAARRRKRLMIAATALLIVAIGLSRLYLGVHYFSDVVGGYAAGLVWLSLCIWGVEMARASIQRANADSDLLPPSLPV